MDKCESKRIVFCPLFVMLLIVALFFTFGCSVKPSTQKTLNISGVVTDYQSNAPAKNMEVKLYTYHPDPVLEYLPPTGHILGTDITNEEGKFRLNVDVDLFSKLEQLSYNKLVVFVAPGISGFKVIDLSDGTIAVDLVTGAPAPAGMK